MKYIYYSAKKGNFGDDLNPWLWPQLFPNSQNSDKCFIGIGSLLHNDSHVIKNISDEQTKIVFGTGIKPSRTYSLFKLNDPQNWDIKFFRGPLSASILGNKYPYISDAAYAMRHLENFDDYLKVEKKYKISLMPYFHSTDFVDWKSICESLGYNYISPLSEDGVEFTIKEIAASEYVITEAMHGAIIADILRVPWHRFVFSTPHTEGGRISEFKWTDWLNSINVFNPTITFIPLYEKNIVHKMLKRLSKNYISIEFLKSRGLKKVIADKLTTVESYYLSDEITLTEIDKKIGDKLTEVRRENSLSHE